jgi:polyisoprenoid-binding protein YceI
MTSTTTVLPTGAWVADPVHSTATFAVRHMAVSTFRGRFDDVEARLDVAECRASLTGSVRAGSLVLKDPAQAEHVQGPDFFAADRHPSLRFASTALRLADGRVELDGDLTIRGLTRPVRIEGTVAGPLDDPFGGRRLALALETVVDRREFGMGWNLPLPGGRGFALGNEVQVRVELELTEA